MSEHPLSKAVASVAHRKGEAGRYLLVSVVNVVNHQVLLILANSGWGWSGGTANVFAAMVAGVPAYLMSRYWVWDVRGRPSLWLEIVPFWSISLLGLLLSTLFAEVADRVAGAGVWVSLASLAAYFIVWVAKFLVLDGMFKRSAEKHAPEPVAGPGR